MICPTVAIDPMCGFVVRLFLPTLLELELVRRSRRGWAHPPRTHPDGGRWDARAR